MTVSRPGRTVTIGLVPVADIADRRVRDMAEQCSTCDFRPDNCGNLAPGQLARLVRDCAGDEGHIVCHETGSDIPGAVCAGFAAHPDAGRSLALRVAATGLIHLQVPDGVRDR